MENFFWFNHWISFLLGNLSSKIGSTRCSEPKHYWSGKLIFYISSFFTKHKYFKLSWETSFYIKSTYFIMTRNIRFTTDILKAISNKVGIHGAGCCKKSERAIGVVIVSPRTGLCQENWPLSYVSSLGQRTVP